MGPVNTEDQWVQRTGGTVGSEDQWVQRTRGTVGSEDQWVQRTREKVGTEDMKAPDGTVLEDTQNCLNPMAAF